MDLSEMRRVAEEMGLLVGRRLVSALVTACVGLLVALVLVLSPLGSRAVHVHLQIVPPLLIVDLNGRAMEEPPLPKGEGRDSDEASDMEGEEGSSVEGAHVIQNCDGMNPVVGPRLQER